MIKDLVTNCGPTHIPEFSIVIPWCDRPEIETALIANQAIFSRHDVEIVVVNAAGDCGELTELLHRAGDSRIRAIYLPEARFNRSLCRNIGVLVSGGEFVFLLDADIVLKSDLLGDALGYLRSGSTFVAPERIVESKPRVEKAWAFLAERIVTTEFITADGRRAVLRARTSPWGIRPGDGIILARRSDMFEVGGLNSDLPGWGFEDTDLQIRLQLKLGLTRVEVGEVMHLTHATDHREAKSWEQNLHTCTRNYSQARYTGCLDGDARSWRENLVELPLWK